MLRHRSTLPPNRLSVTKPFGVENCFRELRVAWLVQQATALQVSLLCSTQVGCLQDIHRGLH